MVPMDFRTMLANPNPELEADIRRCEEDRERDEEAKWDAYCYEHDHAFYIEEERREFHKLMGLPNMKEFLHRMCSARAKWEDADGMEWEDTAYKYFDKLYQSIVLIFSTKLGFFKAVQRVNELVNFFETGRTPLEEDDYQYNCRQDG